VTAAQCVRQCGSAERGRPFAGCSRTCRAVKQRYGGCSSRQRRGKLLLAAAVADQLLQHPVLQHSASVLLHQNYIECWSGMWRLCFGV
jgi:hypothetical protein